MALRVIEGFESYLDVTDLPTRSGFLQWRQVSGGSLIDGRSAGKGLNIYWLNDAVAVLGDNLKVGFIGFAVKIPQSGFMSIKGLDTRSVGSTEHGPGVQFTVTFNGTDGSVSFPGGRTTNNVYSYNVWMFVEVGWRIASDGTGRVQLRINEVPIFDVAAICLAPAQPVYSIPLNTNEWVNSISIGASQAIAVDIAIDDLYVCDGTTGPGLLPCNTFLGDHRVISLIPNGNAVVQWTPGGTSVAGQNWQQVTTADRDATYNSSSTIGTEDLFTLTTLPANVVKVLAVQVTGSYKKMDAAYHTVTQRLNSGGTEAIGTPPLGQYSLSSDYTIVSDVFPIDPHTGA